MTEVEQQMAAKLADAGMTLEHAEEWVREVVADAEARGVTKGRLEVYAEIGSGWPRSVTHK